MKRILIKVLLFLFLIPAYSAILASSPCQQQFTSCLGNCNCCSHTFFRPRPISQDLSLELALSQYNLYYNALIGQACVACADDHAWFDFQATPFYYQSDDARELGKFFSPHCKENFTVGQNNASDISSAWLELLGSLASPYSAVLNVRPKREAFGATFKFYFDVGTWFGCDHWLEGSWLSVYVPVVAVRHKIDPCQLLTGGPGIYDSITSALCALDSPEFHYGKITAQTLKAVGIDDLQVKVGYNITHTPERYWGVYFVAFAPTGKRSQAEFLFEPVYGSGHTGLGAGMNGAVAVFDDCTNRMTLLAELRYAYFLHGSERRSIDLINGDWSRYLLTINPNNPTIPFFGINSFTQPVQVTPGSTVDLWLALHADVCSFDFEFGYDFWWRQKEKVCFECCVPNLAIFDIAGCPCRTSASTAQICQAIRGLPGAPVSDPVVTLVPPCQYNLDSAAHPSSISNKLYLAFGIHGTACELPTMLGIGGSYEIGEGHSALSQWGIWGKASLAW